MYSTILHTDSGSRLANESELEKVTTLDLLGPRLQLINVPARVCESAGQKVGLLRCKPKSKLASKVDLTWVLACTNHAILRQKATHHPPKQWGTYRTHGISPQM